MSFRRVGQNRGRKRRKEREEERQKERKKKERKKERKEPIAVSWNGDKPRTFGKLVRN